MHVTHQINMHERYMEGKRQRADAHVAVLPRAASARPAPIAA
jgi:hypothetical protein